MTHSEPELITPDEVAARLKVKPRRVRGWERRGFLTPIRTFRGERRYLTTEVAQLAARNGR
ncbi:MerR family transcriptional regulator [Streptomyces sp. LZ34]